MLLCVGVTVSKRCCLMIDIVDVVVCYSSLFVVGCVLLVAVMCCVLSLWRSLLFADW